MPTQAFSEGKCFPNSFFSIIAFNFISPRQSPLYFLKSYFLFSLTTAFSTVLLSSQLPLPVMKSTAEGKFFIRELSVWQNTKKGRFCRLPSRAAVFQKRL